MLCPIFSIMMMGESIVQFYSKNVIRQVTVLLKTQINY